MRRRPTVTDNPEASAIRFAWVASFFATIALVAILVLANSAQAATPAAVPFPAPALTAALEEDEEEAEASEDDEAFEFEDCESEDESEFCEGEEEDSTGAEAPPECLLSNAEATVAAAANRDQVRLQIRYRTTSPTIVTVDYGLHGGKGSLYLGSEKKRFGRSGVLRLSEELTEAQMAKVMAAKGFTVRLRVAAAPRYCQSLFDRQLDVRQNTPTGPSWTEAL
ncbi:MAG TPA: hypothetical protein VFX85_01415 [Solirubrobacterales bacterium]|nr:hypothetical protein [Solirubrobacterales bacterium]